MFTLQYPLHTGSKCSCRWTLYSPCNRFWQDPLTEEPKGPLSWIPQQANRSRIKMAQRIKVWATDPQPQASQCSNSYRGSPKWYTNFTCIPRADWWQTREYSNPFHWHLYQIHTYCIHSVHVWVGKHLNTRCITLLPIGSDWLSHSSPFHRYHLHIEEVIISFSPIKYINRTLAKVF
jgi:hypothetical protein